MRIALFYTLLDILSRPVLFIRWCRSYFFCFAPWQSNIRTSDTFLLLFGTGQIHRNSCKRRLQRIRIPTG